MKAIQLAIESFSDVPGALHATLRDSREPAECVA